MLTRDDLKRVTPESDTWKQVFEKYDTNFNMLVDALLDLGVRNTIESFVAEEGQTSFTLSQGSYSTKVNALVVFVNGVRQFLGEGFTETSTTSFSLTTACVAGDVVKAVYGQMLPLSNDVLNILNNATVSKIQIGTVTSVASDQLPEVINSGTLTEAVLNFKIPKAKEVDETKIVHLDGDETIVGKKTMGEVVISKIMPVGDSQGNLGDSANYFKEAFIRTLVVDSLKGNLELTTTKVSMTILATSWSGQNYSISNPKITSTSLVILNVSKDITKDQYKELTDSNLVCVSQEDGVVVLKALGEVPKVDLPVELILI